MAWTFFGSDECRELVRRKVEDLFPAHEVERFTAHFWGLVQFWRKTESDRLGKTSPTKAPAEPSSEA